MIEPIMPTNVSYEVTTIAELSVVIAITWWGVSCLIIFWVDPRPTYTEMMKHIVKTFESGACCHRCSKGRLYGYFFNSYDKAWGKR